ncbi:dihydrofolate reductase family protein [Gordonia paraffinivorans]|uniref:dihydrofolate reductase family protein n=1 Tax=Gordonia paraffinivorans TaxID=175628 RepID=UPI0035E3ECB2
MSGEQSKNIYVDGGATIRSFLRVGLLDELTVAVVPVILGARISLFGEGVPETSLRVRGSHVTGEGLVRITYEIAPA